MCNVFVNNLWYKYEANLDKTNYFNNQGRSFCCTYLVNYSSKILKISVALQGLNNHFINCMRKNTMTRLKPAITLLPTGKTLQGQYLKYCFQKRFIGCLLPTHIMTPLAILYEAPHPSSIWYSDCKGST